MQVKVYIITSAVHDLVRDESRDDLRDDLLYSGFPMGTLDGAKVYCEQEVNDEIAEINEEEGLEAEQRSKPPVKLEWQDAARDTTGDLTHIGPPTWIAYCEETDTTYMIREYEMGVPS